ncbi:hypothetical protein ASC89_04425 [Devosia sp. Root413D1]|uniref:alpha/beta fold hydrolase n=1 Tax=Devosia sp. Root413D1 TaxID=1736531 RepID=UPI0006F5E8BE|nr:alpha/beta hydrolase [Devosia sp. Root413D1]KQW81083.1 hypothetical protein ASC89_04425 [Devosia sp. Root413D1]
MPLILILRFLFSLLSFAILGAAGYFLWRWYNGTVVIDADGVVHRIREDWTLWLGIAGLAWSFIGGLLLKPVLAKRDVRLLKPAETSEVRTLESPTGSSLHVEAHGPTGAPVIILTHGWGLDSTIWGYTIEDLRTRFRVIAWDLPGLGRSKGKIALETFAADLRSVIGEAGGKVVLVGHSIGGMTIQTLVRDDPAFVERRVAGIVLLNTTYTNPLRTMILSPLLRALRWPLIEPLLWLVIPLQPLAWLSAWQSYLSGSAHVANRIGFGNHVTRSQLNAVTLLGTRNSPAAQARGNLAMFRWDATAALSQTKVPVLVVGGQVDIVTKPEASRTIGESAVAARTLIVDEVNHMGFLERYETYNAAIDKFAVEVFAPGVRGG